jgi:Uncharacterized protein conserved in bacteria (DUF2188)
MAGKPGRRDVVPSKGGKGWDMEKPHGKVVSHHHTQTNAEKAAKKDLGQRGGGEVAIHGKDGRIRDKDTVPPARDPNPPKDTKH